MSEASGMVLSQYQTLSTIDDGPNPVVLVRHAISGRLYVKKTLAVYSRPVYDALAALPDTRGIPAIHYLCEEEGRLIIIEDYIHGQTLEDLMALRRLTTGEIFTIMDSLCAVLSRLHHAPVPIVHRDIKPANVIITQEGAVRLIDFNASRLYQPGAGEDTRKLGTPGYAAPEQFGFSQSDARSDIYALGVLLGVMATGRPPQERAGDTAIPRPLGPIAAKCTAMDPDDRYQDVDKLRQDLAKGSVKDEGGQGAPSGGAGVCRGARPGFFLPAPGLPQPQRLADGRRRPGLRHDCLRRLRNQSQKSHPGRAHLRVPGLYGRGVLLFRLPGHAPVHARHEPPQARRPHRCR